jgi:CRP-like cAMP-binding protein
MNFDEKCSSCTVGSCALYALSKVEVLSMEDQTHQTKFHKGEILRKQDTPLASIIYLRNGYVKEYMSHDSLSDQVIQLIKPRSYIGLQSLNTNKASVFSYQAITDIDVCFIEKSIFNSLISGNGNFAREILISLSHEYLSNQKRFLSLNQTQIFGKVAGLLIYLSEEVYENPNFDIHLKRTELAEMVASTRESVTRTLKWFHNEGIILMDKNMIKIQDGKRLSEIAKRG